MWSKNVFQFLPKDCIRILLGRKVVDFTSIESSGSWMHCVSLPTRLFFFFFFWLWHCMVSVTRELLRNSGGTGLYSGHLGGRGWWISQRNLERLEHGKRGWGESSSKGAKGPDPCSSFSSRLWRQEGGDSVPVSPEFWLQRERSRSWAQAPWSNPNSDASHT